MTLRSWMMQTGVPARRWGLAAALLLAPQLLTAQSSARTRVSPEPAIAATANLTLVDDVDAARAVLELARTHALADRTSTIAARATALVRLGVLDEAEQVLADTGRRATTADRLAGAELRVKQHRYRDAAQLVRGAGRTAPREAAIRLFTARLQIQAWQLDSATAIVDALLADRPRDANAALLRGRIHLLEKRYPEALEWAQRAQEWAPRDARPHVLEADVRFWNEDLAGADAPLRRALALDPFDADARFHYGYAIWRRVDARQLGAMAAQWNLALTVDPLHYLTHWHFGNGHTHLTYADYAHPTDSLARVRIVAGDSLLARGDIAGALASARDAEREFAQSTLPTLFRGSIFYLAYEMDRAERLDSAQATFAQLLARKPNYGPAHNAMAAVAKQRQFDVLAAFDSLEGEIARTPTPPDPSFDAVFADVAQYPGDRVRKMARMQLGPSIAYLPLIARRGKAFMIPPLHHDLADVMKRPFFRGATTFDNRQWMDIRGVGSGAAGIEYVERGAHWERNVLNHEYVHLFHSEALTDAEVRRIRALYYDAMRDGRTLDYYAANNESEFFAQAYEAYISPVKAHPLNHKAMNTREDLRSKDPATFAFVESLVTRESAYLAGDRQALASNWAQVYANIADSVRSLHMADSARNARSSDSVRLAALPRAGSGTPLADSVSRARTVLASRLAEASALLDTALTYDAGYIPALLSYAVLRRVERRFDDAEPWLDRAQRADSTHAAIYAERARLVAARAEASGGVDSAVLARQSAYLERAVALETDIAERGQLAGQLRELYLAHARLPDAIRVAEEYVRTAPTVSTYLRDRRDDAAAFAWSLRAVAGDPQPALAFFRELAARKPQNWGIRAQYAEAANLAGSADEAVATLEDAQRILVAGGNRNAGLQSQLIDLYLQRGDTADARAAIEPLLANRPRPQPNDRRLVRSIARLGDSDDAERRLAAHSGTQRTPFVRADVLFTEGVIAEARGDVTGAREVYRQALEFNPYHRGARDRWEALK